MLSFGFFASKFLRPTDCLLRAILREGLLVRVMDALSLLTLFTLLMTEAATNARIEGVYFST